MKLVKILITALLIISALAGLVSCGKKDDAIHLGTEKDGEYTFELYGNEQNIIRRVNVIKGGKKVSSLICNGTSLKTEDLNFDGHKDIMISSASRGEGYYECFIYQPNTNSFTRNKKFDNMLDPVLLPESNKITCKIQEKELLEKDPVENYKITRGDAVFYWKNGSLLQLSESGIEYFTADEIYCVYTSCEIDGEFKRNDPADLWFWSYEELTEAGYTWDHTR